MTTQRNIDEARLASADSQQNYDKCKIDLNAFEKYLQEINQRIWDASANALPKQGPLTVGQAASINIVLPDDYAYPKVFANPEIWNRAGTRHAEILADCKKFAEELSKVKSTLEEIEADYIEDLDRAKEIADKDPAVIAAKENAEAERIKAKADLEKTELENKNRRENMRMLVGGLVGLILVIVILKAFKIF